MMQPTHPNNIKRRRFEFLTDEGSEEYLIFLKEHIFKTNPTMLSVVDCKDYPHIDGEMLLITVCNDIENPNHDIIACCLINNQPILVWNDSVYAVAIHCGSRPAIWVDDRILAAGLGLLDIIEIHAGSTDSVLRIIIHKIMEPEDERIHPEE